MAYEPLTFDTFKKRLSEKTYEDGKSARRAIGKSKQMSEKDKKEAYALVDKKFGESGTAAKSAARPARKPAAKATSKRAAKRAAAPAVAKKTGRAKRAAKKSARKPAESTAEDRPVLEGQTDEAPPPSMVGMSSRDIASNPFLAQHFVTSMTEAAHKSLAGAEILSKKAPDYDASLIYGEAGDTMRKAMSIASLSTTSVLESMGHVPPADDAPPSAPAPAPELDPKEVELLAKSKAVAEKMHGPATKPTSS